MGMCTSLPNAPAIIQTVPVAVEGNKYKSQMVSLPGEAQCDWNELLDQVLDTKAKIDLLNPGFDVQSDLVGFNGPNANNAAKTEIVANDFKDKSSQFAQKATILIQV